MFFEIKNVSLHSETSNSQIVMKRNAIKYLYQWKASNDRKPLIMLGARQVGKTWLMQEFAKEAYPRSAYVNFEANEMLR